MTEISINTQNGTTTARTPYHPEFPPRARKIGGSHTDGEWTFDARDEQRVRDLCKNIYGTDGEPHDTATVRYDMYAATGRRRADDWWMFGRCLASRRYRDYSVRLGPGVILIQGGFPGSGGSQKNPDLEPREGTIIEVRDVPAEHPDLHRDDPHILGITRDNTVDVARLRAERERLVARIAEIDAHIEGEPTP